MSTSERRARVRPYGYVDSPAVTAVMGALRGHGTLDRPDPRRVLLTARCPDRDRLGYVVSTRIGPVWVARPRQGWPRNMPPDLHAAAKEQGQVSANANWRFAALTDPDMVSVPNRCRHGEFTLTARDLLDALAAGERTLLARRG